MSTEADGRRNYFDDGSSEEETLILDSIDRFLERDVKPYAHDLEANDEYPEDIVEAMKELGLFGAIIDPEFGGLGLSASTYAKIVERISSIWMSVTGIFNSHLIMAAAVQRFGTGDQKQLYLPKFASGEIRGGLALTEPDCGTDLQAIRTVAKRDGDDYVINGTKTWISNGIYGQCFALLVKTNPEAEPKHRGMSLFLAEKTDGFKVSKKLEKLGYKGIDSAELIFEDYRVPADRLIRRRRRFGTQARARRPRARAHQCRSPRRRDREGLARRIGRLFANSQDVRQTDLPASGDSNPSRQYGDAS